MLLQEVMEPRHGETQTGFYGAERNAEIGGDFCVWGVSEESQTHYLRLS
jgi:hypothetical protein